MRHNIQTGNIVQTLLLQLKAIFETSKEKNNEDEPPPKLVFDHEERIVKFGDTFVRLSRLLWFLLLALVESPDGTLDFLDSCDGEQPLCPWRKKDQTKSTGKRSAASRLSIRLWERGIPYKVIYRQNTNRFELVLINRDEQTTRVVCITSHAFLAIDTAEKLRKLIDALIFLLPVLQNFAPHELDQSPVQSCPSC